MDYRTRGKGVQSFVLLFVLFSLMFICMVITYQIVMLTLGVFFGIEHAATFVRSPTEQIAHTHAALYLQVMVSGLGIFILPVVLYHLIFRKRLFYATRLDYFPPPSYILLSFLAIVLASLGITFLVDFSRHIPLPDSLSYLRAGQHEADQLIDSFFGSTNLARYALLVLVMAVLPAIGEELCFRGTIQPLLAKTSLGQYGAIIITALCFAFMHLEFDNFLAIWCLGIVLGLLFYYSGSLWASILAHFTNNLLTISLKFAVSAGAAPAWLADDASMPLYVSIPASIVVVYILYMLAMKHKVDGIISRGELHLYD
jgi:uncharacterized protein